MPPAAGSGKSASAPFEVKGALLKGFLVALERNKIKDAVLARIDAAARQTIEARPLPSEWLDGRVMFELNTATLDLYGPERLEELTHEANRAGLSKLFAFGVESTLRLFGVSPATLFTRMNQMAGSATRGIDYQWTAAGPRAGTLRVIYVDGRNIPRASWISIRGGLRLVFDFTRLDGIIEPHNMVPNGRANAADYLLRW